MYAIVQVQTNTCSIDPSIGWFYLAVLVILIIVDIVS